MAKAEVVMDDDLPQKMTSTSFGEVAFVVMPMETYKALSDAAKDHGLTFAQAMSKALNDFVGQPPGPRVLTENK